MKQTGAGSPVFSPKTEIEKIRALPKGKRWEYIWEYYRLTFFLIAFALFFFWMIGSFLVNMFVNTLFSKDPVSIAFAAPGFVNSQEWMDHCKTAIGYSDRDENLQIMTATPYTDTQDEFRITSTVWLANGQPDIFVVEENTYRYLLTLEVLAEIPETWPPELQQLAKDYMVDDWGLEISGTSFARAFGIDGAPAYLCMYLDGSGSDRALDIVEYILTED